MSETTADTTELTSQYSAQVAGDLERNLKEQERLSGEIEALQAQLAAVRHDHTVLVNIQQALGITAEPVAAPAATVPSPRKKAAATGTGKQTATKKTTTTGRKRTTKKTAAKAPATSSPRPTLVELVREHLAAQTEPRSAAEVTTALAEQHPDRAIKTTVVRTTLEGLVAKNHAQRTKQGSSVFYTAPDAEEQPTSGEQPA
ncbi:MULTISPECIES: BlaI/MecI/CopY family transcriptional regulator [Streptomyces]|uniref:BlaI/MecI/CopY family transcriptional regulator n=1 Tax=Streptomyces spinosisporus TaxID=2927582 RepID=A0ABS9XN37_9ACTN|nr:MULTISPECIES: BlaI/MecI/CopY family transcriptional regulator [Streptomyces]MCI3243497.1 BlaI/MecI/CopY family transcriptional regulator [Streptomyces spinosisporus]